jgi:RNA polymerase sigma-70 factor (ECF subfamily)
MANKKDNIEAQLIARCNRGDGDAFKPLVERYRKPLFTYLMRCCGEREFAEDLFQETLLKTWKYLPGYKHHNKFAPWLFGIAHSVAVDAMRHRKSREHIYYTAQIPDRPCTADPSSDMLAGELQRLFEESIFRLPEKQRQVFLLRQQSGMAFKEIAAIMNQPLNTVLGHMHYAVSRLKTVLSEQNVS